MFLKPLIVTCHSIKQFHYTCSSIISFLCCDFIVLISTYHSLIFFTIASLHFISSIQFKICCQNKSFRCSSLGNTYKTLHTVLCAFNHFTIILLFPLTSSNLCNPMCIFIKVLLHIIRLSFKHLTTQYDFIFYHKALSHCPTFHVNTLDCRKYFHKIMNTT